MTSRPRLTTRLYDRRRLAELLLVTVAMGWAAGFIFMKTAITNAPVLVVLWLRFALATLVMLPFCINRTTRWSWGTLRAGIGLGGLLFGSFYFLICGLQNTTAANTGILSGFAVVWVPLLSAGLQREKIELPAWCAVALSVIGLVLLAGGPSPLHWGDLMVSIGSLFTACHIIAIDRVSITHDEQLLALLQIVTVCVLSFIAGTLTLPSPFPDSIDRALRLSLLFTALISTAYAFWVQTRFQRYTTPTRAAIIFNLEPVFTTLLAYALLHEPLSMHTIAACAVTASAMMVAQWRAGPGEERPGGSEGERAET